MLGTKRQILIGGAISVIGWLWILLMVSDVLTPIIELYIVAYTIVMAGFMIGMFGAGKLIAANRHKRRQDQEYDDEYDENNL